MIPLHYVERNIYKSRHSIYSINKRFSSDRYQKVARHLTGSFDGFWFIFQTPDTLPDIKKYHFLLFFFLLPSSTPYGYLNILNLCAQWLVDSAITRAFLKNSIKLTKRKIVIIPKEVLNLSGFSFIIDIKLYLLLSLIFVYY